MKIDFHDIINKLESYIKRYKRYLSFSAIIGFLLIYSFLVLRINLLMRQDPRQTDIDSRLQNVQRPKIDPVILDKIQSLQDQNVQVQTLFKQARDNPFSE
jgi:hypothetical protein